MTRAATDVPDTLQISGCRDDACRGRFACGRYAPAAPSLSEQLSQKIAEARRAEHSRYMTVRSRSIDAAMNMDQSTPQAMRTVLKRRADLFETLQNVR